MSWRMAAPPRRRRAVAAAAEKPFPTTLEAVLVAKRNPVRQREAVMAAAASCGLQQHWCERDVEAARSIFFRASSDLACSSQLALPKSKPRRRASGGAQVPQLRDAVANQSAVFVNRPGRGPTQPSRLGVTSPAGEQDL